MHLVVTDPPYNEAVKSDNKELNESGRDKIMNDDMSDEEFPTTFNVCIPKLC